MRPLSITWILALSLHFVACAQKNKPIETLTAVEFSGEKITKTPEEWKKVLSPQQYHVLREQGTERAFTGKYWNTKEKGIYACAACGLELFSSDTKYDSGSGWPSFYKPLVEGVVGQETDRTLGMLRTEVHCMRCDGHLGHVFDDGPKPTGLRYCINSVSLNFKPNSGK